MKKLLTVAMASVIALCSASTALAKVHPASPKGDVESDAAIRKLYEEFTAAWNRHDVRALAKMWTEDGDHVEPDGHIAKSRPDIEKLLTAQHKSVFKTTRLTLTIDDIWFVTSDVALVDGSYEVSGVRDPDGKEIAPRKGHLTSLFLKEGARWSIVADRLMIPAPLPWRKEPPAKP